jgi:resuscitation-promoting factor RpfB
VGHGRQPNRRPLWTRIAGSLELKGSATKRRFFTPLRDLAQFLGDYRRIHNLLLVQLAPNSCDIVVCARTGLSSWDRKERGLIGRGPLRRSHVLVVSVLTAGLAWAGFFTTPQPALAGARPPHTVIFTSQGEVMQNATRAATVGDFLREQGIVVENDDYVAPTLDTPISDRMTVEYRPAVSVTIVSGNRVIATRTSAIDVASLLATQNIHLGRYDSVEPQLDEAVPADGTVRILHYLKWQRVEHRLIAAPTIQRVDLSVTPGASKTLQKGAAGERDVMVSFVQRGDGNIHATVLGSHLVRAPRPRIVEVGAREALHMVATAYSPYCGGGCRGVTATGTRAGRGIVAVDPRIIPLGSRLYIPGYGYAVAGDTGGAIIGARIDLGMDTDRECMNFGRREVIVYRLK